MVKTMVIGQHLSKISTSNRIALPKKFRTELGGHFVITKGYEQSLLIVAYKNWQTIIMEATNRTFLMGEARDTARFLLGNASSFEVDEQGRFVVPEYLKEHAQLKSEGVFVGLGNYIELWDFDRWKEYQKGLTSNISEIGKKLADDNK